MKHENMFKTGVVPANECYSLRQVVRYTRDIFSIFLNLNVCCVLSLESPHRGDSNENTQYTFFNIKKKENHPKLSPIFSYGIFPKGHKNKFETGVVNELSVFEPLKFYYSSKSTIKS